MDQVVKGRCLSSQAALPPSGLSPEDGSQAKPAAANAGDWLVYRRWDSYAVAQLEKLTEKQATLGRGLRWDRRIRRDQIVAHFSEKEAAEKLLQSLYGAHGEYQRRVRAAKADYDGRVGSAHDAYTKAAERLIRAASGMSAGTAETAKQAQGQRPASPVGASRDAHPGAGQ